MIRRPEQLGESFPGTWEIPGEPHAVFAVHHPTNIHGRSEGMAGGKKAEMTVRCTKANAKQCKSIVLKALFKMKIKGVEGKLRATLTFPDLNPGDLDLSC